jgi:type 1 glutamine amidotransferase
MLAHPVNRWLQSLTLVSTLQAASILCLGGDAPPLTFPGGDGPGKGKHIVLLAGDEEYRSEEGLPMLAKILAVRHGFKCTVLFSMDPKTGKIDPNNQTHMPGLDQLSSADLVIMLLRFREWPDADMKLFVDYLNSGKPIFGLRTSTHAFAYSRNKQSPYARFDWQSSAWPGGFGQQVFGDTWISHHGNHGKESTRGVINPEFKDHPVLRGVEDIWGPSDVYGLKNLPIDVQVLVHGQVLTGMEPTDPPVTGAKNNPMMPVVWLRNYTGETGKASRIAVSTMGASTDLQSEGLRRLLVNTCFWCLRLENSIPAKANVDYVGEYRPTPFGFNKYTRGVKPSDHALK